MDYFLDRLKDDEPLEEDPLLEGIPEIRIIKDPKARIGRITPKKIKVPKEDLPPIPPRREEIGHRPELELPVPDSKMPTIEDYYDQQKNRYGFLR